MSSFGSKHDVNAWFMYVLVTNLPGSDLHLNSMFLQPLSVAKRCSSSNKASNSPAGSASANPYIWTEPPGGSSITGSERSQKRGQNEALTRPENSFGNPSLPPAWQQVSSRNLEAVWQQLGSSFYAAQDSLAAAQHRPDNSLAEQQASIYCF